jgi:L-iditol 2-dehydrogenase
MLALVKTTRGEGHLALLERPEPIARPGWVSIAVMYGGICGTDLHILHDRFPYWPPVTLGHEFVGTVATVGNDVDPALVGVRVVSEPHSMACGTCFLCRRGNAELCAEKRSPGWGIDGTFAGAVTLPVHLIHRVPDDMPDRVAALAEPMAVAVTALTRGGVDPGDTVVVIGPGPVGILLAIGARAMGAANVIVVGREPSDRLRFAASLGLRTAIADGADAEVRELTAGRGADLIVEATGSAAAIALALEAVRRRGRLVAVGLSGHADVAVPWDRAVSQAVDVAFSMSSNGTAWDPALAILAQTGAALEPMTTVFPLVSWEVAFRAVADRTVIKALLDPRPEHGR